jgi:Leucine Rich repeats (2 copies)
MILRCSKSSTGVDDDEADKTPPQDIADLAVIATTSHTAILQWTAPHDYRDNNSNGMIDGYDLRISYDSITALNFTSGYHLDSVPRPAPAGFVQQCILDELEPDSTYYFAIKSRDDKGNWSAISNCCHAHCPGIQKVVFADTALERIIREHIHKPTGDILSSDVDTITYFGAYVARITSLAGLEYCVSLLGASLWENEITDISPLASARQLWGLNLSNNNITDLSPLAGLQYLRQLHIAENPITNIAPLATMPSLQQLFMHSTFVTDFSPLYGLQHLDDIHLATLDLSDISFISNLTHLRICKLNGNNISSLAPIANLTSMESLDLMMNRISDLGPLTRLVNLKSLNLTYNSITDIQPLVNNTGLGAGDVVHLGGNPLSQLAIDVQIPQLQARGVTVTW